MKAYGYKRTSLIVHTDTYIYHCLSLIINWRDVALNKRLKLHVWTAYKFRQIIWMLSMQMGAPKDGDLVQSSISDINRRKVINTLEVSRRLIKMYSRRYMKIILITGGHLSRMLMSFKLPSCDFPIWCSCSLADVSMKEWTPWYVWWLWHFAVMVVFRGTFLTFLEYLS